MLCAKLNFNGLERLDMVALLLSRRKGLRTRRTLGPPGASPPLVVAGGRKSQSWSCAVTCSPRCDSNAHNTERSCTALREAALQAVGPAGTTGRALASGATPQDPVGTADRERTGGAA